MKHGILYFTRKELRGITFFFVLTLAIYLSVHFFLSQVQYHTEVTATKVAAAEKVNDEIEDMDKSKNSFGEDFSPKKTESKVTKTKENKISFFKFNPNTASKDSLLALGLSSYAASNLIKYRSTGAYISSVEDFSKIYGVTKNNVEALTPYLDIPTKKSVIEAPKPPKIATKTLHFIDINSANPEEFAQISGIGPVLSERIVKFRDKLGGFISIDQVDEVYGINDTLFLDIKPFLLMNDGTVVKIPINSATYEELAAHPYISKKLASLIVNYRSQHGDYLVVEDLRKIKVLDEDTFIKILPYLSL